MVQTHNLQRQQDPCCRSHTGMRCNNEMGVHWPWLGEGRAEAEKQSFGLLEMKHEL
jgi:hypothetical protein